MKSSLSRIFVSLIAAVLVTALAAPRAAAVTASDNAANYSGWNNPPQSITPSSNGGFGYTPWVFQTSTLSPGDQGMFLGSANGNGGGGPPDINTSGKAFGMYANGDGGANNFRSTAFRGFDFNGDSTLDALLVGSTFSWGFDNGGVDVGGSDVGLSLRSGNANSNPLDVFTTRRFGFEFQNGFANYKIIDGNGVVDTGIGFRTSGLELLFTLTGDNTYALSVTNVLTGTFLGNFSGPLAGSGGIQSFAIFDNFANPGGGGRDVFFNSFVTEQVPEPSTILLWVAGAGALALVRRRSRQQQ